MPVLKGKQVLDLVSNKIVEEAELDLMDNNQATVLANLVDKGILGVKIINITTASITSTLIATNDYRTASLTALFANYGGNLPNAPVAIVGTVLSNLGRRVVIITRQDNLGFDYRICHAIATTARVYSLRFFVFY